MMALPLGYRVSGHIGTMCPIRCCASSAAVTTSYLQVAINMSVLRTRIMRGDYYVVPPNSAHIQVCAHDSKQHTRSWA